MPCSALPGFPLTVRPEKGTLEPGASATVEITADTEGLPIDYFREVGPMGWAAAMPKWPCPRGDLVLSPPGATFSQRPGMPSKRSGACSQAISTRRAGVLTTFPDCNDRSAVYWWVAMPSFRAGGRNATGRNRTNSGSFSPGRGRRTGESVRIFNLEPSVRDTGLTDEACLKSRNIVPYCLLGGNGNGLG